MRTKYEWETTHMNTFKVKGYGCLLSPSPSAIIQIYHDYRDLFGGGKYRQMKQTDRGSCLPWVGV